MPKPIIRAVFKRELKSWFTNPTGYIFIVLFVLAAAFFLTGFDQFFEQNLATLDTLSRVYPYVLLFFVPALTMGIWANERANGTQELLFTLPARDFQVVLGKYLAVVAIYTVALLFTALLPAWLFYLGTPDWGLLVSTYLGYWLLGMMLIAASMLGSLLFDNLAVSFILGALVCAVLLFFGFALEALGLGNGWRSFGPLGIFSDLTRGVVAPSAFLLFLGWTAAFLYLNLTVIQARRQRDAGEFVLHCALRFGALLIAFTSLTIWGLFHLPQADITEERIHSLSAETRELLGDIDPERKVMVQAFVSDSVPEMLVRTRRSLLDLLDQYDRIGGDSVAVRIVPTEPFSDAAEEAADEYEINGQRVDPRDPDPVFLGFAVQCGTDEVTVPFLSPGMSVEYELTRSIRTVANVERRKVGILKTDVEFEGSMDFQTMRQRPSWPIVDELKLQYEVEGAVSPDEDYPEDLAVLIVPMVSSLTQPQMDRLRDYIVAGNKTILLDDPSPQSAPGMSATDPKGGPQNPMMRQQPPTEQKGNVDALLRGLDIDYPYREIVFDAYNPHAAIDNASQPELVFAEAAVDPEIRPKPGLNPESPITKDLRQVVSIFGGHCREADAGNDLTFTPLIRTSGKLSGTLPKTQAFTNNPLFGPQLNPYRPHRLDNEQYVLGCRVTGKVEDGGNDIDVVFLADLDMVSSIFFQLEKSGQLDALQIHFDNVALIHNSIDELVGDRSFIELRSRQPKHNTLTRIEREQRTFNEKLLAEKDEAEKAAKEALDAANQRLKDRVAAIEDDPTLDAQSKAVQKATAQQEEQRRVDRASERIEQEKLRRVARAERERRQNIDELRTESKFVTMATAPLPALLVGLVVLFLRVGRAKKIVPEDRKRSVA